MWILHLVPALPWHYPWFPAILATICWGFLLLGATALIFAPVKDKFGVVGACLPYIVILRLLLLFWTPTTAPVDPPSDPVVEWRHRTSEAEQILRNLKADREMLQERFHEAETQKGQPDLFQNRRGGRLLTAEIAEIDADIKSVERESERLGAVVVGMEMRKRRKDRREMVSGLISAERREEAIRGELEVEVGE